MCAEHGLGERFLIADARPEAPQLLAAADIVVAPSLDEAWGLVVSEGMAAGKAGNRCAFGRDSGEPSWTASQGFSCPP